MKYTILLNATTSFQTAFFIHFFSSFHLGVTKLNQKQYHLKKKKEKEKRHPKRALLIKNNALQNINKEHTTDKQKPSNEQHF